MVAIYVRWIQAGRMTLADVPEHWRAEVEKLIGALSKSDADGTETSPIVASSGMEYVYGLYYLDPEDGKTYLCKSVGVGDGGTVFVGMMPHELVGEYFEEVL